MTGNRSMDPFPVERSLACYAWDIVNRANDNGARSIFDGSPQIARARISPLVADIVSPRCPWPKLNHKPRWRLGPMTGRESGKHGMCPIHGDHAVGTFGRGKTRNTSGRRTSDSRRVGVGV